jgi:polysaccharide pyruvyl transferase WcaK-like protein
MRIPLSQAVRPWLVFGHFGGRNFGDEVMLHALLGEGAQRQLTFKVLMPPEGREEYGPNWESKPLTLSSFVAELRTSRGLIFANGTSFHDGYHGGRYMKHLAVMGKMAAMICVARLFRKPVVWLSASISPNDRPITRALTSIALGASSLAILRDEESMEIAKSLGVSKRVRSGADLAPLFCRGLDLTGVSTTAERIGVSVVPEGLTTTAPHAAAAAFLAELGRLLGEHLSLMPNARVTVFVIGRGRHDNDEAVSSDLHEGLARSFPGRVDLIYFEGDPAALACEFRQCTAMIAMRLHAALVSDLLDIKTIWVPYHRKVSDIAGALGVPAERVVLPDGEGSAMRVISLLNGPFPDASKEDNEKRSSFLKAADSNIDAIADELPPGSHHRPKHA